MKKIVMCQLSIMLESGLPSSIDYEMYARNFYDNMMITARTISTTIPDKKMWNRMPPEVPRIVCVSDNVDFNFSANNALFVLKNCENWNVELERLVEQVSTIFIEIGNFYKLNYRLGVVLTTQVDHESLCTNALNHLDTCVTGKPEWQLSFLDKSDNSGFIINNWKRFIQNKDEEYSHYIIDVNTCPDSEINLRGKSIKEAFGILNNILEDTYNEFTE